MVMSTLDLVVSQDHSANASATPLIIIVTWILTGICINAVCARLCIRAWKKKILDSADWIMLAALVRFILARLLRLSFFSGYRIPRFNMPCIDPGPPSR